MFPRCLSVTVTWRTIKLLRVCEDNINNHILCGLLFISGHQADYRRHTNQFVQCPGKTRVWYQTRDNL